MDLVCKMWSPGGPRAACHLDWTLEKKQMFKIIEKKILRTKNQSVGNFIDEDYGLTN